MKRKIPPRPSDASDPSEKQLDDAVQMTFPASDPMAYQNPTESARARDPNEAEDQKEHGNSPA